MIISTQGRTDSADAARGAVGFVSADSTVSRFAKYGYYARESIISSTMSGKKDRKKKQEDADIEDLPFPETGLSPALQRTIKEKLDRGELDEVDMAAFEKNLRKLAQKTD